MSQNSCSHRLSEKSLSRTTRPLSLVIKTCRSPPTETLCHEQLDHSPGGQRGRKRERDEERERKRERGVERFQQLCAVRVVDCKDVSAGAEQVYGSPRESSAGPREELHQTSGRCEQGLFVQRPLTPTEDIIRAKPQICRMLQETLSHLSVLDIKHSAEMLFLICA
ncbi:hypothetical protein DNTS_008229 [Danionella cerebrum]|uniref:Uncharacterized protein n=1 Tax=Danionella cerebrum TaxID=2873325 RepID=A0A553NGH6_9TELE|nr:hypothetical protein DNTS_008229 [Danionella translucida]